MISRSNFQVAALSACITALVWALFIPRILSNITIFDLRQSHTLHSIYNVPPPQQPLSTSLNSNTPQQTTINATFPVADHPGAICETQACHDFAATIKASLAPNYTEIDPCDDFASYVCDGWTAAHPLASSETAISQFSLLRDSNVEFLRALLDGPYPGDPDAAGTANRLNFELMQGAYRACMNTDDAAAAGLSPLRDLLARVLPPATTMPDRYSSVSGLTNVLAGLKRETGVDALVSAYVREDDARPGVITAFVGGGAYGLPSRAHYGQPDAVALYTDTIEAMLIACLDFDAEAAQEAASGVVRLEAKVARLQQDFTDQQNDVAAYYNPTPFLALDHLAAPRVSLIGFLKTLLPASDFPEEVIVTAPAYFAALSNVLKEAGPASLHAYLQWQVIRKWGPKLAGNVTAPLRRLENFIAGRSADVTTERWRLCLGEVDHYLGWIESSFYVQGRYNGKTQQLVEAMVQDLKAVYHARMQDYEWMTAVARAKVQRKIETMAANIGFPGSPDVSDPLAVRRYYQSLPPPSSGHFENALAFERFRIETEWQQLGKPGDKESWVMTVPTVNAYYKPMTNSIFITGGMLQEPFFSAELPAYVSYGGIGAFAGHEITHAFDVKGSLYDEAGAYGALWDEGTRRRFLDRAECFVEQYSRYAAGPNGTQRVDGRLTLDENVADAGGLSAAYAAWTERQEFEPDPLLPGLGPELQTSDRLFFVAFAMKWCRTSLPEEQKQALLSDPHSPADKRIIGTLANSREFRKAFGCAAVEPECQLW